MTQTPQVDPIDWLLEPDGNNPSVRYFSLRDLLSFPESNRQVPAARAAIMRSGPVPKILAAQEPEGYWVKPGGGYSPKYRATSWSLLILAELGADPSEPRIQRGCEYYLDHSLAANQAFSANQKPVPSGAVHCLNGNMIFALQRLGYGNDLRLRNALELVRRKQGADGRWKLENSLSGKMWADIEQKGKPSKWITLRALRTLHAAGLSTPDH